MDVVALHWPAFANAEWQHLGGGYSGAVVMASPEVVLKGWPMNSNPARIEQCHRHSKCLSESLECVPRLIPTVSGRTWAVSDNRTWELSTRRPGVPATESEAPRAAQTIAAMHRIWNATWPLPSSCPVAARVNHVQQALKNIRNSEPDSELLRLALSAAGVLCDPFPGEPVTILCHGDLHGEHILFEAGLVSGLIDFASVKTDHPALDLARYYGDYNDEVLAAGVENYRHSGGHPAGTIEAARYLDRIIALGAACHWLRHSSNSGSAGENRIARLKARLQRHSATPVSARVAFP